MVRGGAFISSRNVSQSQVNLFVLFLDTLELPGDW
jgi:hypothetical protein